MMAEHPADVLIEHAIVLGRDGCRRSTGHRFIMCRGSSGFLLKTFAVLPDVQLIWATVPRYRGNDQLMRLGWKVLPAMSLLFVAG